MNIQPRRVQVGNQMTEQVYRDLRQNINATAVKKFISDREGFVKEFIYGDVPERKESAATTMGSIVHCLILEKEQFEEKYTITQMTPPTGQMLELVNEMYRIDRRTRGADGKQEVQFETVFMDAVQEVKFRGGIEEVAFKKKTPEWILAKFTEPDKDSGVSPEQYYRELLQNTDKTVVTIFQIQKAEDIVNEMKGNEWISGWVNAVSTDTIDVYNEYPIVFEYKTLQMKSLIDRIIVNHIDHTVEILDIKSTWDGDGVSYTYVKNMWYVQTGIYQLAVQSWMDANGLQDYTLVPIRWLICDTTGFMKSVSYGCTAQDVDRSLMGFTLTGGRKCIGVEEALDEIIWCMERGEWKSARSTVEKQGNLTLDIQYAQ